MSLFIINEAGDAISPNPHIQIPQGVERVAEGALHDLYFLKELTIPASMVSFGPADLRAYPTDGNFEWFENHFGETVNLEYIHAEEGGVYKSVYGVLYKDTELTLCPPCFKGGVLDMPENCEAVGEYACHGAEIKEVCFPKSLKRVKAGAFLSATFHEGLTLPKLEYGVNAFRNAIIYEHLTIPADVQLSEKMFAYSFLPRRIDLKNEVVPKDCFDGARGVGYVRLHDTVKEIDENALGFSPSFIHKIYVPEGIKLHEKAFHRNGLYIVWNTSKFTLGGVAGGEVQKFAKAYNINFEAVENTEEAIEKFLSHPPEEDDYFGGYSYHEPYFTQTDDDDHSFVEDGLPF